VVSTVAERFGINPRLPLKLLSVKQKEILLNGTGDTLYRVVGKNRFGNTTTIEEKYNGIIAELKRRYIESESDFVRAEIENICGKNSAPPALDGG